ncbi:SpoIIIAH-like family protein [Chengkuizengella marina]|uniref:SpoIIIAH-like family protein n=1 Tax=Chengkuizengella marina TaxID=2507566 RepID=A0A6N9PXD3_9BACL|nr:SpoIIIAH-like family protein [Chengkuizengella marina]NBI27566.1 SpoIIIAH-like family protein [Chengkuizengella marina]
MRSRRQTIWLVSMLSIMVVLSGYYLFSEDVNEMDTLNESVINDINEGESEIGMDSTNITEDVDGNSLEWLEEVVSEESMNEETVAKTDEEVLQQIQTEGLGGDYYTAAKMQRLEDMEKEMETLLAVVATSDNMETYTKAYDDIQAMEDKGTKVDYIEEQLMQTYPEAMVTEKDDQWKVEIQTSKLEKSEAVSIIDLVVSELEVKPGQVSVKVRP